VLLLQTGSVAASRLRTRRGWVYNWPDVFPYRYNCDHIRPLALAAKMYALVVFSSCVGPGILLANSNCVGQLPHKSLAGHRL
jgi:hypothetical protein